MIVLLAFAAVALGGVALLGCGTEEPAPVQTTQGTPATYVTVDVQTTYEALNSNDDAQIVDVLYALTARRPPNMWVMFSTRRRPMLLLLPGAGARREQLAEIQLLEGDEPRGPVDHHQDQQVLEQRSGVARRRFPRPAG